MAEPALDYSRLPAFGLPAPDDEKKQSKGILGPGLKAGLRDLEAVLGSAVQGGGKLFGSSAVADAGKSISDSASAASAAAGRPDLEVAPWRDGGASVLPWLGYQAAKQVPMLAAYLAGGKVYGMAGGEAPAALERLGALAPRSLGGGGLRAGADIATRRAAAEAGKEFAQQVTGGAVAGLPIAFGSMVQEADQKPGGLTTKDALHAAALSPFYSALDALEPAQFKGLLARGQAGNIVKRVATAAFVGAAMEVPQEGIQTAMEQSFRPDLSIKDKMANIVDAAVSGGAVGGVFGGIGGVRAMKRVDARTVDTNDIASAVDQELALPSPQMAAQAAPATNEQVAVAPTGTAMKEISPFDFQRSEMDTPAPRRPYEGTSTAELTAGLGAAQRQIDAGTASEDVQRFAEAAKAELETRNNSSTTDDVASDPSRGGAAQAESTVGDGGTESAAPAPASSWNDERDTLLKGISTRQRYKEVTSREDLAAAVRTRLENGSTAKGDFALAERLGIDTNAPAAAPVETAPASTADKAPEASVATQTKTTPVAEDPEFVAQWKDDVQKLGQRDKGARSIKPANLADAQRQLYQALGKDTEIGDGLEKLAQKYGVLDEDKRLTDVGVSIAQKEPIAAQTVDKAARSQGFMGTTKEMFASGVQAALGGEQVTKFDNHPDFVAYQAGAQWAEEHNSVPKGALKKYDPKAQLVGDVTDEQARAINGATAQPRTVPEGAKEQASANVAIDKTVSPATQAGDLAQLKRMVREGDVQGAMEGLKRVQAGETLFEQPETKREPFKGESVTRGAPRTGASTTEMVPTKAASRASAEAAIRKHELRLAIDAAHAEGVIGDKQRLQLVGKLRAGRVADVAAAIPTSFSGEKALRPTSLAERTAQRNAVRQRFEELAAEIDQESEVPELSVDRDGILKAAKFQGSVDPTQARAIQSQLEGKSAREVMDLLVKHAPTAFQREVAAKVKDALARLERAGIQFNFRIARGGDVVPEQLRNARGMTVTDETGANTSIWINGTDGPGEMGLSYEIVLHEMLHAVTMHSIVYAEFVNKPSTPLGRAVAGLQAVSDAIKAHFSNRSKQGNLTPLENYILGSNALDDAHETLAWALSSPEFQSYLDTIDYTPRQTLWGRFVQAIRTFLGLGERSEGALAEVLRTSEQIMSLGPPEVASYMFDELGIGTHAMRTPGEALRTNETAQKITEIISKRVPIESVRAATRKMVLGWNTIGHMVAHYAKQFPQLALYAKAHYERRATQARWAQLFEAPYQVYENLERTAPKVAETIGYLMSLTQFQVDPTKTWDQHEHLHGAVNEARLKEIVDDANRKYNLLRGKGHSTVYDDFRSINEATHLAMMAVSLHNLVISDPVLSEGMTGFDADPTDAFRESAALHESPQNAKNYWQETLDGQLRRADEYIQKLRGSTVGSASEQRVTAMRLEPIEMRIRSIRESLNAMRNAPYFHLGRHGDHFVSFTLRTGENGLVDQDAIDRAGKVIQAAGYKNIEISRDQTRPKVYIRVDTIEARKELETIVRKLQKDGWLKPDSEIKAAPRSSSGDTGTADHAPAWLERYIELLQASPMFEPTDDMSAKDKETLSAKKAQMVSHARELWLDMLPDTAIAKVMVHRNSVPGFDKDMIRNFAFRFQVGVNSLSNLSANAKLTDAFTQMRAAVFDAQVAGSAQHGDVDMMQQLLSEVLVREAQRPLVGGANWIDTFRAINHAYFLGFSPSYVLVNTTQLGVLLWPELAKKHGFANSARAIGSVTKVAFNIMKETLAAGAKVGPKRALDAVITEDVLRKAEGVDEATANYLMKVIAEGWIDIGGSSRELGRVAGAGTSEHLDTGLRWAASFGLYSETFTRLVAALAARKLSGDNLDYARKVTEQSMLNYADWNTARQMGKMGFAGPMTKVMTAFMQYNVQVLEKLYREFYTGIVDKNATATEKTEARRFLAGHLTAVTALAGTLGLPFATVAATVIEKLADLWDDDDTPFDATAAWRNFLTDIFGPGMGEMVARGLPRAGGEGFDFSQRAGEQNLLPFTQFLTDKRKWKDASSEAALRSMGAPTSMLLSIAEGGEKMSNGDVMGGMTAMLPMSLKGPAKAYQMYEDGYKDANGNTLPMSPKASAILGQLIGLTPQARAEYSEARGDQAAREGVLVNRAKVLRQGIADAVISGDHDAARDLIRQAKNFDAANPSFAVLPDIENAIGRRMKSQAISQATRTPIGTNPKDKAGRALTQYANIEFARQ